MSCHSRGYKQLTTSVTTEFYELTLRHIPALSSLESSVHTSARRPVVHAHVVKVSTLGAVVEDVVIDPPWPVRRKSRRCKQRDWPRLIHIRRVACGCSVAACMLTVTQEIYSSTGEACMNEEFRLVVRRYKHALAEELAMRRQQPD